MNIFAKSGKGLGRAFVSFHWIKGLLWSLATVIVTAVVAYFASPEVLQDIPQGMLWIIPPINAALLWLKDAIEEARKA